MEVATSGSSTTLGWGRLRDLTSRACLRLPRDWGLAVGGTGDGSPATLWALALLVAEAGS